MSKKLVISLLLIITIMTAGCGFQLRGKVNLPEGVEPLFIGGIAASSQLAIELRNSLGTYGVALTETADDAQYKLNILKQKKDKRSASLGQNAKVVEYQLIDELSFELRNTKGERVLGPKTITERKILPNDRNKVVSSKNEEDLLRREMLQNLAAKIARQLRNFDYSAQTQPASE